MLLETIRRATTPSRMGESVEKDVEAAAVALLDLWADLVVHQPNLMDVFLKDAAAGQCAIHAVSCAHQNIHPPPLHTSRTSLLPQTPHSPTPFSATHATSAYPIANQPFAR